MGESITPTAEHEDSVKQVERLRQHLIELDQEMEAESIRHERERTQMMKKIKELEEALAAKDSPASGLSSDSENQKLKKQIVDYQLQLDNMKLSVEILESRIEEEVREKTANLILQLQKKQLEIDSLSKMVEEIESEMETHSTEREIMKKLENDAKGNARLIDDLNSEINELHRKLDRIVERNSKDPDGLIEKKIIAGLIVACLSCTDKVRRVEFLSLVADMLCLDTEQRLLIGIQQHNVLDEYTQPKLAELWTAFLIGMSLISNIPVGSKTRSVSLHSSPHTNEVLLATGSWDNNDSNEIQLFSLKFDLDTMESDTDLQNSQVTSSKLGKIGSMADVNWIQYCDFENLLVARGDGVLGLVKQNGYSVERLEMKPSACLALDIVEKSRVSAVYRDGDISFGHISQKLASFRIPLAFTPTQVKWCDPNELVISTTNSKVLFYDVRSTSAPSSCINLTPQAHRYRPLKIRALHCGGDSTVLCTGDDEGLVRVWDKRSLLRPVAESTSARKPISSMQMHSSIPSCIISSAIDGSIIQHHFDADQATVEDAWQMPSSFTPAPVNNLAMLGSLTVAAMDNANVLVWRSR